MCLMKRLQQDLHYRKPINSSDRLNKITVDIVQHVVLHYVICRQKPFAEHSASDLYDSRMYLN